MDYSNYFEELNNYEEEQKEEIIEDCCDNKQIIIDEPNNLEICESCGNAIKYYELIQENYLTQTNPYYKLTSVIPYSNKYKSLHRLQKWGNYSYEENTALVSYKDIRKIGLELEINNEIINNAIQLYKNFYIHEKISTRNKIKQALYIYCLFYYSFENNFFNIFEVLKKYNLTIANFNKAIVRTKFEEYFLQQNMINYINIIKKNYNIEYELQNIILLYNEYLKKKTKFNSNTILVLVFYDLLKITNKNEFFKLFNISKSTLKKIMTN